MSLRLSVTQTSYLNSVHKQAKQQKPHSKPGQLSHAAAFWQANFSFINLTLSALRLYKQGQCGNALSGHMHAACCMLQEERWAWT